MAKKPKGDKRPRRNHMAEIAQVIYDSYPDNETAMDDLHWIGLTGEENAGTVEEIEAAIKTLTPKEVYEQHIEPRFEGIKNGFYMQVVELCVGDLIVTAKRKPEPKRRTVK